MAKAKKKSAVKIKAVVKAEINPAQIEKQIKKFKSELALLSLGKLGKIRKLIGRISHLESKLPEIKA